MKKVISFYRSLKSYLKQWVGKKAQNSKLTPSEEELSSVKCIPPEVLEALEKENANLKEEVELLKSEEDKEYDI